MKRKNLKLFLPLMLSTALVLTSFSVPVSAGQAESAGIAEEISSTENTGDCSFFQPDSGDSRFSDKSSEENVSSSDYTPTPPVSLSSAPTEDASANFISEEITEESNVVLAPLYDRYELKDFLNVRKGPGTNYAIVSSLTSGDNISVLEEAFDANGELWGKIVYDPRDVKVGWIALRYCRLEADGTSTIRVSTHTSPSEAATTTTENSTVTTTEDTQSTTTSESPSVTVSYLYKVTASALNVRSGAGTGYSRIDTIYNGTEVTVLEISSSNWGKINYNGKTGWISLDYCSRTAAITETQTTTTETPKSTTTEAPTTITTDVPVTTTTEVPKSTTTEAPTTTTTEAPVTTTTEAPKSTTTEAPVTTTTETPISSTTEAPVTTTETPTTNSTEASTTTTTEAPVTTTEVSTTTTTEAPVTTTEVSTMTTTEAPVTTTEASTTTTTEVPVTSTPETDPSNSSVQYVITASALNVRTGPGTTYTALGLIYKDAAIDVLEISANNWGKINFSGKTGWISLEYCKQVSSSPAVNPAESKNTTTTEPSTVTTTETAKASTTETAKETTTAETGSSASSAQYKVTASALKVRTGPDTSYASLGLLSNGSLVTVTEISSNKWGKVTFYGKTGWISLEYCEKYSGEVPQQTTTEPVRQTTTESATTTTTEAPVSTTQATEKTVSTTAASVSSRYKVTASALNVRSGPGTTYSVTGSLNNGDTVTVIEISSNQWGKISYNGTEGWVSMEYLSGL